MVYSIPETQEHTNIHVHKFAGILNSQHNGPCEYLTRSLVYVDVSLYIQYNTLSWGADVPRGLVVVLIIKMVQYPLYITISY